MENTTFWRQNFSNFLKFLTSSILSNSMSKIVAGVGTNTTVSLDNLVAKFRQDISSAHPVFLELVDCQVLIQKT